MKTEKFVTLTGITHRYPPKTLIRRLGFREALCAADALIRNDEQDSDLRHYAVEILELLRRTYPETWSSSWRYDAYLGYAHDLIPNYFSRYAAYIRALVKVSPRPPRLLIEIARCCNAPIDPPLTEVEATFLLKRTMQKELYVDGVVLLISLYKALGETMEEENWTRTLNENRDKMISLPPLSYLPETEEEWFPPPDLTVHI